MKARGWHRRLNVFGYHIAIEYGPDCRGIAVWPRKAWPKDPIVWLWQIKTKAGWRKC